MQNNGRNRPDARKLFFQKYEPIILVALNNEKQSVTILDNGSGMNLEILKKYFLNVGVSYYNSDAYKLQGTEIVLDYEQFMIVFPNGISEIKSFIEDNFLDCGVLIKILV